MLFPADAVCLQQATGSVVAFSPSSFRTDRAAPLAGAWLGDTQGLDCRTSAAPLKQIRSARDQFVRVVRAAGLSRVATVAEDARRDRVDAQRIDDAVRITVDARRDAADVGRALTHRAERVAR